MRKLITVFLVLSFTQIVAQSEVKGWSKAGAAPDDYDMGITEELAYSGSSCAYIFSKVKNPKKFGTLLQATVPGEYLGRRVKMTGYLKTENVENWSAMWMRVDDKYSDRALSFDNMYDRHLKGTNDWTKCEIVLLVPENASSIVYGFLLDGKGKIWFDNITFEVVENGAAQPTAKGLKKSPTNLDFE